MKNVSHRNAPGAISAIAFTVSPVNPNVEGGFGAVGSGDIGTPSRVSLAALTSPARLTTNPLARDERLVAEFARGTPRFSLAKATEFRPENVEYPIHAEFDRATKMSDCHAART